VGEGQPTNQKKQQQQPFEFEDMGFDGATAPGA
jgi:hypothetical protein